MKKIAHITPALPPAISGLGDFCKILADSLERDGITNVFLIRNATAVEGQENVYVFASDTLYQELSRLKPDVIILHYVGYAYHKYALPFYIVRDLQRYRRNFNCKFIVFFHEIYSSSRSVLKLPFYTDWLQQMIVKRLMSFSDKVFTNCTVYGRILMEISGGNDSNLVECTGLFSNVPEDLFSPDVAKEEGSLMVFGSHARRQSVYDHESFPVLLKDLKIQTVYDVGPGNAHFTGDFVTVLRTGPLQSMELAQYFNKVKYGVLNYERELLGKSGIFAAYAAFGIIPINLGKSPKPLCDSLVYGVNYFDAGSAKEIDQISGPREKVLAWYKTRDKRTVAEKVEKHL